MVPPGGEADAETIVGVLRETVSPGQHADMFAVLEQMDEAHPRYPHWYLPWLGVDPAERGAGLGGQLLKRCLKIVDDDHMPAFLETPNPRTISFYERHGFQVTSVAQAGAVSPGDQHGPGRPVPSARTNARDTCLVAATSIPITAALASYARLPGTRRVLI
jgi:ribosomal protein S18 acetylase RimI-like enzyme